MSTPSEGWAQPQAEQSGLPPRRPADLPAPPPTVPEAPKPAPADQPAAEAARPADPACLAALTAAHGSGVRAAENPAAQDAACVVAEPVVVEAMTVRTNGGSRKIALQPPPTLSCATATVVAHWLETSVAPLAQGHFARELTALRVGGGHECRRRNRSANGPQSEHATGSALDIFAFVLGEAKANGGKPSEGKANEAKTGEGKPEATKPEGAKADATVVVAKPEGATHERFLAAVRQSACGAFATSLGPGSDAAHADHLHVDIRMRRAASSRFCQ
ncbi:hypothetical protein ASE63_19010 [Bosea sp. Root381]|uniref:extensin-like domain-containing protein n=1 Tax=Bosea sp. Root381 TaxID=1736524 RepID=UPI0006F9BE37|nr:extensin family protein [Bosea sp. Root381]KRE11846.1 hypothetical protein ASE63_19010 [Bosea sp. Root381]